MRTIPYGWSADCLYGCNVRRPGLFFEASFPMQIEVERKRFTVDEYYKMAEAGILTEEDRVELIEGEIIKMSPIGNRHAMTVTRASMIFARGLGDRVVVATQNPAHMDKYNEPQPDLVLIRPREGFYGTGHPDPEDVVLLIEVADSSLRKDRLLKLPVYARNRIREVWIIDVKHDAIYVHREPHENAYLSFETKHRGETV
jgi:Uma2 family endonuclease